MSMAQGFKEFAMKGNVVYLAVGVTSRPMQNSPAAGVSL